VISREIYPRLYTEPHKMEKKPNCHY